MDYIDVSTGNNEELQKELLKQLKAKKFKKKILTTVIIIVLVLLTVLCAWIYGRNQAKRNSQEKIAELENMIHQQEEKIQELIETPIVVSPVSPEINLDIINSEIRDISELATVEYLFTDAAKFSDSKQIKNWNIPFTEKSFLLKWDGVIKAGIKVDEVIIEVEEEEKKIIVSVPEAEILSYDIDEDSVEVLDEKNNIFNEISVDDKVKFDAETEEAMKNRAIENGILEKAQKNAEYIISNLLTANPAIGDDYVIEFVINAN